MTDVIEHRGPDGDGHWISENQQVAFGHRRLSIIDLSAHANQPMHYGESRYTITFNGEIYNYIELKEELIQNGYVFHTDSDTEVLLALYDQKKEDCLNDLDGMFAFAIWDAQEEILFCARDRFGEKPFHYSFFNEAFYFSSEMKSMWAAGVPKIKNEKLFTYFEETNAVHHPDNINETFFESIWRLEHGHWMKVKLDGSFEIQKYFDIDWRKQDCKLTFQEACLEFNRLFQLGLQRRFRADVQIGTSLSGGLDSSSIVCNIRQYLGQGNVTPLTFSTASMELRHDLELLAARFGSSIEQVAHRLSTLQRPGAKGVPIFFARIDRAGNITKRHSAAKLQFARFGAACPLWNVHQAFEAPGRIIRQLAETPDGVRYLSIATEITKSSGGFNSARRRYAIALGCEISYAPNFVYADGLDLKNRSAFDPIGISCRICERANCTQRAIPPLKRRLLVDKDRRTILPYTLV